MHQGLSEPVFFGDLVYELKKSVGSNSFSAQFVKIVSHYGGVGYKISVLQRTACLVVRPVAAGGFAFLFGSVTVGRASGSVADPNWGAYLLMKWWGPDALAALGPTRLCLLDLFCPGVRICLLLGPCLCIGSFLCLGLCVMGDDALVGLGSLCRPGICVSWSISGPRVGLSRSRTSLGSPV